MRTLRNWILDRFFFPIMGTIAILFIIALGIVIAFFLSIFGKNDSMSDF